ncbi:hypothetical protein PRIPAC_95770 [Pristionchus pacificus]|uniref:GpcrRhopsn4 domain-containing protein n=1 Tax=Pristionchus pacificus TaxID=54126 RepID=A0A2A6CUK1_PRIPA|nr:hypothetical protein PRIPAC_95770 [Pristionchus pacificus]|eukprot:PDM81914.1 hypothetical protein PRIPAC_34068 [Pristionchus pacificus]
MRRLLLISVLFLVFLAEVGTGKRSRGFLASESEFLYLDRFCFLSEIGNLYMELRYPLSLHNTNGIQSLLLYYDTQEQWHSAYQPNKSCQDRIDLLDPMNNQQVRLTPYGFTVDRSIRCEILTTDGLKEPWVRCFGNRRFDTARARWWYLAVSNCENGSQPIYLEYDLTMTNGPSSDSWFYQFSADEFYKLSQRNMLHQTFKMYIQAIISLACKVTAYGTYARNGMGLPFMKLVGQLARASAETCFIILLLLIAKGYTITRSRLTNLSTWKLTLLMCLYVILYMAMFVWQMKIFDPAVVTYVSESYPGYGIQALRLLSWLSYTISSITTCKKYPKKREFYLVFGLFMSLWFWMGPVTLYLSNFLLDNWVREEVVNLVECCVVFYGFIVFMVITRPSMTNKNFPFHVRTTQIGDMTQPADFPQNAYEAHHKDERRISHDEMTI